MVINSYVQIKVSKLRNLRTYLILVYLVKRHLLRLELKANVTLSQTKPFNNVLKQYVLWQQLLFWVTISR
nr:MAG TPA: hypothetical protein [Caudoviricetes sp.]